MNAEQIQFIKDWYNDPTTTKKEKVLLEKLYPEVKESEDEKIRKFLVQLVSNDKENNCRGLYDDWKTDFDNVLAWLEKQKIPEGSPTPDLTTMLVPNRYNEHNLAEWSKEDEKCCKIALLALNDHPLNQDELKAFNWLRALKSRFGWKPSEDQIQALYNILEATKKAESISVRANIVGLIRDLEKLK